MTGQLPSRTEGFVTAAGQPIHYVEQGSGEPLLLIHGAFGWGARFMDSELGTLLSERYRVVAPDSLGHGQSGAPPDPQLYGASERASHLAAVLDTLDIGRAHVVGYSMGGWMASAFATHHPGRVASLAIGGWDVERGMYTPAEIWGLPKITGDILIAMARQDFPELTTWVGPESEPALAAAIDGMNDLEGLAEGVQRCPAPVTIWIGEDDLYFAASKRFAAANRFPLITLPGNHQSMLELHGREAGERISRFIGAAAPVAGDPT